MTDIVSENSDIKGIRGWLYVPAFIVATSPVFFSISAFDTLQVISRIPSRVRSAFYLDMMLSFMIAAGFAYSAYLMWHHRKEFPKVFMALMAAAVAKVLLLTFLLAMNGVDFAAIGSDFARVLAPAIIWIPYMLKSRRVAATFVD